MLSLLVAQQDSRYEEWGFTGSVRFDPGLAGARAVADDDAVIRHGVPRRGPAVGDAEQGRPHASRGAVSFARWWPALLARVDGERLPGVLDILMDCGGGNEVRVEIERRRRGVGKPRRDPLLLFYLAVIRYKEGSDHDARVSGTS